MYAGEINSMELKLSRWKRNSPPSEADLLAIYRQEGLSPYSWSNAPGDTYTAHIHGYHKVLYVVRGKITWILPDLGKEIETGPGDRLDLPRGTTHAARVGSEGVTCLEAHLD
jgi:quercetin dioxygenase-like cupin family protein